MKEEYSPRARLLRLKQMIIDRQYGYTKRQLAERLGVSTDTITSDFNCLKNANYVLKKDKNHRYGFAENKPYKELKDLLHFSEEDQILLMKAIDNIDSYSKKGSRLKKKLASLYDYHRLGHAYLRKPYLKKVDLIEQAKTNKKQIILKGYRSSNSNVVTDRLVEAFHCSPPEDSLHAYDVDKKALRHFRISRVKSIKIKEEDWAYEGHHNIRATDPFRIVMTKGSKMVNLRMKVGAYNELTERFPLTDAYIEHDEEEGIYDFQCNVNEDFYGLTNFILGFHHQLVEIVSPDSLIEHVRGKLKDIEEKLGEG